MIPAKYKAKKEYERELRRANRAPVKVQRVNRGENTIRSTIFGKPERTPEGFLVVPVVIAQKMVLDYPEFETKELLGDAIFLDEYVKSCDGCPFVLDHPKDAAGNPVDVMPDNYREYIDGIVFDPQVDRENDRVVGKLKIFNPEVIQQIENGDLRELSQGYTCKTHNESGEYGGKKYDVEQVGIVMNHLALVENGRAGDAVKVLYNNSRPSLAAADLERIERRRENMKTMKRNGDETAEKQNEGTPLPDEKNNEGEEQQATENDRMAKLEAQMATIMEFINKQAGNSANMDSVNNEDAENPKPEEEKKNEDLDKKVENAALRILPQQIAAYNKEAELAYSQAQALIGESFQDIARRANSLAEFRKLVLAEAGVEKTRINSMSAMEASVRLEVLADQAKTEINAARRNAADYNDTGERIVRNPVTF